MGLMIKGSQVLLRVRVFSRRMDSSSLSLKKVHLVEFLFLDAEIECSVVSPNMETFNYQLHDLVTFSSIMMNCSQ